MSEIWKPVPGYEGYYDVSSTGDVRSFNSRWGKQAKPKPIKPALNSSGYLQVVLSKQGITSSITNHILVALAFLGPRPDGYEVNHINGNKTDNCVENLEYVTDARNTRHARDELNSICNQILTRAQVEEIIGLLTEGKYEQGEIGALYGVTNTTIASIWGRFSWADLPRPYPPRIRYSNWRKTQHKKGIA